MGRPPRCPWTTGQGRPDLQPESRPIRVLLVDDHSIMREGLESMMQGSEEFQVVGQTRDGDEAVAAGATCYFRLGICAGLAQPRRSRNAGMPSLGRSETRGTSSIRCRGSWCMVQRWPKVANTNMASIQAKPSPMHRRGPPPKG